MTEWENGKTNISSVIQQNTLQPFNFCIVCKFYLFIICKSFSSAFKSLHHNFDERFEYIDSEGFLEKLQHFAFLMCKINNKPIEVAPSAFIHAEWNILFHEIIMRIGFLIFRQSYQLVQWIKQLFKRCFGNLYETNLFNFLFLFAFK